MPVYSHDYLRTATRHIFQAAGSSEEEASILADGLVGANLKGHDSHGVIQVPIYIDRIKKKQIIPGAPIVIEQQTATTARINGNWGFGFVVTRKATEVLIEKALAGNIAAVTVYQQSHIGRLGQYPAMCAERGLAAIMFTDSGRGPKAVAPFGGRARRLGTNPVCICVPSNEQSPVFIDMATSAVAGNKILLAQSRHQQVPPGWIIDKQGNPTTDPAAYQNGGALLPVGGDQGHKGYGLSFMSEVFSGILTTLGFGLDPQARHNDGCFIAAWRIDAFMPLDRFKRDVSDFIAFIKTSPPARAGGQILYPGEIEARTEEQRRRDGIEVEDETADALQKLIDEYGIAGKVGMPR